MNRICGNPSCNNSQPKNKYGNYKTYCSTECSAIGRKIKCKITADKRTNEDKLKILERRKQTNQERYGVDNVSHCDKVKQKIGKWHTDHAEETQAKIKQSNLDKYGVESTNSLSDVKERKRQSFLEKYGVDHQLKIDSVKQAVSSKNTKNAKERLAKAYKTNMERYGVKNASASIIIKDKRKETMLDRYGVENPSQVAWIHEKQFISRVKKYKMPSGNMVNVQGYEPQAIDLLLETISENNIKVGKLEVPEIWYTYNGKKKRYYPDIYIYNQNLIIEVKCNWTYKDQSEEVYQINLAKKQACLNYGYKFAFMIFNNTGTQLLSEKNW